MINTDFLKILCCPETHQVLALVDAATVERLNAEIASGQLKNRAGKPVTRKCDAGLLRQDGQFVYPICEDIPILLIDEAIPMAGRMAASS